MRRAALVRRANVTSSSSVLLRFTGPRGEIAIDRRYAPLYMSVWAGDLDVDIVEQLFAWTRERAQAARDDATRVAYLNHVDNLHMVSGEVRRRIGELSIDLQADGLRDMMVGSWQVLSNPMIRGLLKAASWVTNGAIDGRVVGNWSDGIELAVAALASVGVAVPSIDPRQYVFPMQ